MQLLKQVTRIFFQDCSAFKKNHHVWASVLKNNESGHTNNLRTSWPTSVIQTAIFEGLLIVFLWGFAPKNKPNLKQLICKLLPLLSKSFVAYDAMHSLSFNLFHQNSQITLLGRWSNLVGGPGVKGSNKFINFWIYWQYMVAEESGGGGGGWVRGRWVLGWRGTEWLTVEVTSDKENTKKQDSPKTRQSWPQNFHHSCRAKKRQVIGWWHTGVGTT